MFWCFMKECQFTKEALFVPYWRGGSESPDSRLIFNKQKIPTDILGTSIVIYFSDYAPYKQTSPLSPMSLFAHVGRNCVV